MKSLSRATLYCLLMITLAGRIQQLSAQDRPVNQAELDPIEKAEQEAAEFKKRVENRVIEEFRLAAQSKLLLEIEELSQVCDLDAKSVKKLEIAAKGAAERWIRNEEQQLRGHVRVDQYGVDAEIRVAGKKVPRPGEPVEEPKPAEQKPEPAEQPPVLQAINRVFGIAPPVQPPAAEENVANITVAVQRYGLQFRVKYRHGGSSSGFGGGLEELKREAVWAQTMHDVVTPEQQKKFEAAVEERRQRLREAAITSAIAQLDLDLRLNEHQRARLHEVFDREVKLGNTDPSSVRYSVEQQIKDTDIARLKPILSDVQLRVWEEFAAW
ncbi:hypothetical protein GC176_09350 [bacterium]|nr:hypothetical protein [bacterium]